MKLERKLIGATIKQAGEGGTFEAVIATFGKIDHDNDIVEPGAFGDATVSVLPAHDSMHVPLGKARIEERGDQAVAVGRFNLEIPSAADWHNALKFDLEHAPSIQQWSWDFRPVETAQEHIDGEQIRRLIKLDTMEISPVLRGSSVGSRTISVKAEGACRRCDGRKGEALGNLIRDLRDDIDGLENSDLADAAGVSLATMDDIIAGLIICPPRERLEGLAGALETSASRLISAAESDGCDYSEQRAALTGEVKATSAAVDFLLARLRDTSKTRKDSGRTLGTGVHLGTIQLAESLRELEGLIASEMLPRDPVSEAAARFVYSEARRHTE